MDMSIFEKSPRKWSNSHIQKLFLSNGQKLIFNFFFEYFVKMGQIIHHYGITETLKAAWAETKAMSLLYILSNFWAIFE